MTDYVISIEGQSIPVPPEIGQNDDLVRQALAPYFPDAANAMITRVEKDDMVTINVVKRAGSKGIDPFRYLAGCPESENPVIKLYRELREFPEPTSAEALLELDHQIEQVLKEGERQNDALQNALKRLSAARPRPAPFVPRNF